jgi:hypothetical protein
MEFTWKRDYLREVEPVSVTLAPVNVEEPFEARSLATVHVGMEGTVKFYLKVPLGTYKLQYISETSPNVQESKQFSVVCWGKKPKYRIFG